MSQRRTEPSKSLLDRNFRYVSAASTDIKKRFAEILAEQQAKPAENVKPIRRSK